MSMICVGDVRSTQRVGRRIYIKQLTKCVNFAGIENKLCEWTPLWIFGILEIMQFNWWVTNNTANEYCNQIHLFVNSYIHSF